jgi:hypothetical protein
MKNNYKYSPEDKARKIIERHLEDAGIPVKSNKVKVEKEGNGFKIIFNTKDKNEAVKDAQKLSMSLLGFESYDYNFQKYPIIFTHNNKIIVNANQLTSHGIIEDIYQYISPHKPGKDSYPLQSMLRSYKGIIHSLLKPSQAQMRRKAYYERQNDLNISCGEYLASKYSMTEDLVRSSKLARTQTYQKKALPNEFFLILILVSSVGCIVFVESKQLPTALGSFWGAIGIGAVLHKNLVESNLPQKERISDIISIAMEESKKNKP